MEYYVRAGALQGYIELIASLGVEPLALLSQVNILPSHIRDQDSMIPYAHLGELLELSAHQLGIPDLGLRLGNQQGLSTIGLIGAHMIHQDTIGQALEVAQKFSYMHAQGALLKITDIDHQQCSLVLDMLVNHRQQYPQLVQMSIGLIYKLIAEMNGHPWHSVKLIFRQKLPQRLIPYIKDLYRCELEFGASNDGLLFSTTVLKTPPYRNNELLKQIINKQFSRQQAQSYDKVLLVRHAISSLLPTGDCSKDTVAQSLGLHPKKLERMLSKRNLSYRQMLEETRKSITMRALQMNNMPLTKLALNLGFSEFSAFSRSFKKWTGVSPSHYLNRIGVDRQA